MYVNSSVYMTILKTERVSRCMLIVQYTWLYWRLKYLAAILADVGMYIIYSSAPTLSLSNQCSEAYQIY